MSAHAGQRGPGLWDEVCSPKMQRWPLLALADLFVINRPHTPNPVHANANTQSTAADMHKGAIAAALVLACAEVVHGFAPSSLALRSRPRTQPAGCAAGFTIRSGRVAAFFRDSVRTIFS